MKAKDLKNSILQMAVEGKLVPQDPNDEPASVLLERIRKEKHRLIAEGKAKFPKDGESIIYTASDGSPYEKRVDARGRVLSDESIADEVPFELPEGWCWARLKDLCKDVLVPQRDKPVKFGGAIPWCRIEDIDSGTISRSKTGKSVDLDTVESMNLKVNPVGTVLCSNSATIGVPAIVTTPLVTNQRFIGFVCAEPLHNWYLYYFFLACHGYLCGAGTGTTQSYIARSTFEQMLVPLPPLAEQRRIAERVSELMPLVDEYGELEDAREELDAALPGRLRRSVLQEAVQGRLVPQDPTDEPAIALLSRVRAERRRLAAEGKAKLPRGGDSVIFVGSEGRRYEKRVDAKGRESEPVCIEDEIPFEIPEGWAWARFTQIVPMQYGFSADSSKFVTNGPIGLIRIRDVNSGDLVHTTIDYSGEWSEEYLIRSGDDLIGMDGEFICKRWRGPDALLNQRVCCLRYLNEELNRDFVSYAINWYLSQIWRWTSKTTVKHLSAKALDGLLFAFPPADEQKRITERTCSLLNVLE